MVSSDVKTRIWADGRPNYRRQKGRKPGKVPRWEVVLGSAIIPLRFL